MLTFSICMGPLFSRLHNALSDTSYLVFADARVCTHPGCHIAAFSACEVFTHAVFSAVSNSLCLQCLGCPRTLHTTCPFFSVWCLSVHWIFILYLSAASSRLFCSHWGARALWSPKARFLCMLPECALDILSRILLQLRAI